MTHHNGWQRTSKLLSPHDKQGDQGSYGTFQSFEHKRLLFTAGHWFPISSIVSLEYNDVLFVGEVLVCTRESDHTWTVLVQVQHLLNGLQSLLHWREQLLGVPSSTVTTSSHFANSPVAA